MRQLGSQVPPRCTWDLYPVAASFNFPRSMIQISIQVCRKPCTPFAPIATLSIEPFDTFECLLCHASRIVHQSSAATPLLQNGASEQYCSPASRMADQSSTVAPPPEWRIRVVLQPRLQNTAVEQCCSPASRILHRRAVQCCSPASRILHRRLVQCCSPSSRI